MRIRFLADADLNYLIILAMKRREPAIDFLTAKDAGLAGLKDPQVLARAAQEDRILVSHDQSTMPAHFADFLKDNNSPGVIMIPQGLPILTAAEDLILAWAASEAEEWRNQLKYLPLVKRHFFCSGFQLRMRVKAMRAPAVSHFVTFGFQL